MSDLRPQRGRAAIDALDGVPRVAQIPLLLGIFAVAYALAYQYGMGFSQAAASPFWFPDSVLLCALLLSSPRRWWMFLVVLLPIRLLASVSEHVPLWFLATTTLIDVLKGVTAAALLRHYLRDPVRLSTPQEFARFGVIAVLLVPALLALAGAGARMGLSHDFWRTWEQWFLGNVTTQVVITPALLFWITYRRDESRSAGSWLEISLLSLGMVASSYLAATVEDSSVAFSESRFYAPVPFLFWAAIRFGMVGASTAIVTLAVFMTRAAIDGHGPFHGDSPAEVALALQNFLVLRAAPIYFIAVAVDHRRRLELRSEADRRQLAHAQRLAVIGELTTTVAHEMRQPLTALLANAGYAEHVLRSPNPSLTELREVLADISASSLHASDAINRICGFVRNHETRMEPHDLNLTVMDALRIVAGDALHRRVELRHELANELPPAFGDRIQLQQVLLNLIANALDAMSATPDGQRVLSVTSVRVDDHIEVRVSDCGCGIAPDLLPQLFDPFFTTRKDGVGLGLAIARSIVAAHKGRLWAENNATGGATFGFTVPIRDAAAADPRLNKAVAGY